MRSRTSAAWRVHIPKSTSWTRKNEPAPSHAARVHQLLEKQDGTCCAADCEETEGLIAEHSTPFVWRRAKPDQLMCKACHRVKTLRDVKAIWKAKRLSGEALSQHERRKRFGPQLRGRSFWSRQ